MGHLGRVVLLLGVALILVGLVLMAGERLGLGRLPGDFYFSRRGLHVWIPITSMFIVSLVLTLLLSLFRR